jgi:Ion channel
MKPAPRPATIADRIDFITDWVIQPAALVLTLAALFTPRHADTLWPVALGAIAVGLIFLEYLETVWSFSQPHAQGRRISKGLQLMASGVLMILAYAAIYKQLGVHDALDRVTLHDPWTALYFSVITTATVGYGDYVPSREAMAFAAAQSLMSIVWAGLFFGVVVSSLWASSPPIKPSDDSHS